MTTYLVVPITWNAHGLLEVIVEPGQFHALLIAVHLFQYGFDREMKTSRDTLACFITCTCPNMEESNESEESGWAAATAVPSGSKVTRPVMSPS